jgi:hypothetical protein
MRNILSLALGGVLVMLAGSRPAHAGWCTGVLVCYPSVVSSGYISYYATDPCCPCPQPVCCDPCPPCPSSHSCCYPWQNTQPCLALAGNPFATQPGEPRSVRVLVPCCPERLPSRVWAYIFKYKRWHCVEVFSLEKEPTIEEQVTPTNGAVARQYGTAPSAATASRPVTLLAPVPQPPAPPPATPVPLNRVVSATGAKLEGQVLGQDAYPQAGARLTFVSADRPGAQQSVTANDSGQFSVTLASGAWLVYLDTADGKTYFQRKIDLNGSERVQLTLRGR